MASKGQTDAILRRPPHAFGGADRLAWKKTTAGTSNVSLGFGKPSEDGAFFTFINLSEDTPARVRFAGVAGIAASAPGAATADDRPILPGGIEEFWCSANEDAYFSVQGADVEWGRSS